jgi:negative regulator of sigma E activity
MHARDTTPESHAAQMEAYRRLGEAGRARLAERLSDDVRQLARDGIRSRHPGYSDEQVELALRRLLYGDELFQRAWPASPLLAP